MTEEVRGISGKQSWRRADWFGVAIFSAAGLCAVLWLMSLGRGLTFFFDEWDFIEAGATTGFWHNVLQPHNGHPSMVPFSVYEVLLHTVGLRDYWPYQMVLALLDVGCGWLLFVLLRRKVHPLAAGAGAAALMLLGPAWQDLLWPFQIGFLGSVAGGLGALTLLDRDTRRADLGACSCLVLSVACSGVGLPFLAGVAVELVWRRRSWGRLWVPALPLALFVIWYQTIGKSSPTTISPVAAAHSMASATATTVGALVGRGTTAGAVVSVLLAVLIIVALVRSPGQAARLAMAVSGLFTFWVLTLLARGISESSPSRYLYPAAALVLVATGELPALITRSLRGRLADGAPMWTTMVATIAAIAVVAFSAVAIWRNASTLTAGRDGLAGVSSSVRAELGAVVLAGHALPPTFQPDQNLMPQVSVGPYLRVVQEFGSSGDSRQEILGSGTSLRVMVDTMLLRGRPMEITPVLDPLRGPTTHDCLQAPIGSAHPTVTFSLPPDGALVTAPLGAGLSVRARSLAASFPDQPLATIAPTATSLVRWTGQPTAIRWQVELSPVPPSAPVGSVATVCLVSPGGIARSPTGRG